MRDAPRPVSSAATDGSVVTCLARRGRRVLRGCALALVAALLASATGDVEAKEPKRPPVGPLITVHTPQPRQFELALDEMELDWSRDPGARLRAPAAGAREVPGARLAARDDLRAIFFLTGVPDRAALRAMGMALKGANPGAEAHLILYEPGLPDSVATRLVLTREVSLIVKPGEDPAGVLAGQAIGSIRTVPGVPGGFVVEVGDPLGALDLADALQGHPSVRSASPLLKRLLFPR